jgi:hypothetical protein
MSDRPEARRAQRPEPSSLPTLLLCLVSAFAGAGVLKCVQIAQESFSVKDPLVRAMPPPTPPPPPTPVSDDAPFQLRQCPPSPLVGKQFPKGKLGNAATSVELPTGKAFVAHVWLQGCADCMPAFRAHRKWSLDGRLRPLDGHVVNVAYGSADPAWATRFGLDQTLVMDEGGHAVVKPLGISTFTSLVVDAEGRIVHADRPDCEGYPDRMVAALVRRQ